MSLKLLLCVVIDIIALILLTITIVLPFKIVGSLESMELINWIAPIYCILFLINFICNLSNKYSKSENCYTECFMCIIIMVLFCIGPLYIVSGFFFGEKKKQTSLLIAITTVFAHLLTMTSIVLGICFFKSSGLEGNSNDYYSDDFDNYSNNNEYQSQTVTNDFDNFATSNDNDFDNFATSNNDFDNNNYDNNDQNNNCNYLDYV